MGACSIQDALDVLKKEDKLQFLDNLEKWDCILGKGMKNEMFDLIKYSSIYCKMDCKVLMGKLRTGKCAGLRVGKGSRNLELQALQTSSLHPRSHWGQHAAFPDMRITLMIWSYIIIIIIIIITIITIIIITSITIICY